MLARNYAETNTTSTMFRQHMRKILWVQSTNPEGLLEREKHTFRFIAAGLKMHPEASTIKMSLAAFADCQRNADLPGSPATVRRSLAGLEFKGFLSRRRCRLGNDRFGLEIRLHLDRWTYWTGRAAGNITPIPVSEPTSVYIPPRQSMRLAQESTSVVNSCNININSTYARAYKKNNTRYNFLKGNPILLTLWILLKGTSDAGLFKRAETEFRAVEQNIDLIQSSGVPWAYHAKNWPEMTPVSRDGIARCEIIPKLRGESSQRPSDGHETNPDIEEPDETRRLIQASIASTSLPGDVPTDTVSNDYSNLDMKDPNTKILLDAMRRVRSRCVDGS